MKTAKYICIEGPDGCGKSSVVKALNERLNHDGVDCFKMPSYDGPIGQMIRAVFDGKLQVHPLAMMHLFNADAIDQEQYISHQLNKGRHVVLDRHTRISGCVYQVDHHPLLVILNNLPLSLFKRIDLCVVLDAPAEVLSERINSGDRETKTTDKLYTSDDIDRLETLRNRYEIAPHLHSDLVERWLYFDTHEPHATPDSIARHICIALQI